MERNIDILPPELGLQSIGFVPHKDLCSLSLTSTSMRKLASDPKLWSNMKVNKEQIKKHGLLKLFSINKFKKIKNIDLSRMTFTRIELRLNLDAIASSFVQELNLCDIDLKVLPAKLLSQVAGHLRKINLDLTSVTTDQIIAVLDSCITSPTLKEVSLAGVKLKNVPAELLGQAVGNLHKVNLSQTNLNKEQCIAVLKSCITSSTLKDVSLAGVTLRYVPAELLGQAVGHLNKVKLNNTRLNTEQCIIVLKSCITSPTLKDVSLRGVNLNNVPDELLGQAVEHLHKINLNYTRLNTEQCIVLLTGSRSLTSLKLH